MSTDNNTDWTAAQAVVYEHILTHMLNLSESCEVSLDGLHTFHIPYRADPTMHLVIEVEAEPIGHEHHTRMLEWTLTGWTRASSNQVPFIYGPHVTTNSIEALAAFTGWARVVTA